jgi:uncharacterized membrane protein YidH (DUF202 family)
MANKRSDLLAEKRTHLAQKRTELAHERTIMSYFRTAATIILFGIAFLGLSKTGADLLFYSGVAAVTLGLLLFVVAIFRSVKHSREINRIKEFFAKVIKFKFKQNKLK